jgi:hypothetical protein
MKKCSFTVLILLFIFNCSYFVPGQATSDESQRRIVSVLSDAESVDETKVTKTSGKSEFFDLQKDFYKGLNRPDRMRIWAQTKNTDLQLKPAGEVAFSQRVENLTLAKPPVADPVKITNRILCCKKTEFFVDASSNLFDKQFYKNFPEHSFDLDKESNPLEETDDSSPVKKKEKFHWKPALAQSMIFLGIQHGMRIWRQKKTSKELVGPFFRDWRNSLKNLRGWGDGNKFFTNYVAHPLQGSFTGRIFINNSDKAKRQEFGKSKTYWESRLKAMAWSAFWSTQFELGPISEASIGNVGMYDNTGPSKLSWGDLIVTPVFGTGVLISEDAIDKYVLKNWLEKKAGYKVTTKIKILRSLLTPTTSLANLLRGKPPWKRDNRLTYQIQTAGSQ